MRGRHAAGLFPFANNMGGNSWALDLRPGLADPSVVFVDHETPGEDGVSRVADGFAAFLARAGIA